MSQRGSPTVTADPKLDQITRAILGVARPNRIVLFGSRARGDAGEWSDYDIFVEIDDGRSQDEIRSAVSRTECSGVDVIIGTPELYDARRVDPGTLEYQVARDGRVLYARNGNAVLAPPSQVREPVPGEWPSIMEWRERAKKDLRTVDQLLAAEDPVWEHVCFHAHQAVEKLLKTVIIAANVAPPHKHELDELLALCPDALRNDARMQRACALLQSLLPDTRYPSQCVLGRTEATAAADAARTVRALILPHSSQ